MGVSKRTELWADHGRLSLGYSLGLSYVTFLR